MQRGGGTDKQRSPGTSGAVQADPGQKVLLDAIFASEKDISGSALRLENWERLF